MLRCLLSILLMALPLSVMAEQLILKTSGFVIELRVDCEEGEVSCNAVHYKGTSLKSGQSLQLIGKTEHVLCADGVTPCRLIGYSFENAGVVYMVSTAGVLSVLKEGDVILQQQGQWHE